MSSTDYSYFNRNNYNTIFPTLPKMAIDYNRLPLFSVNGTQLMTYLFIGVTAVTLSYVAFKENEPNENPPTEKEEPTPEVAGGKKSNKRKTKNQKHKRKNKSSHKK
jgi:hypothetical protein